MEGKKQFMGVGIYRRDSLHNSRRGSKKKKRVETATRTSSCLIKPGLLRPI